jgi:Fe2+ transport system protein FeoA
LNRQAESEQIITLSKARQGHKVQMVSVEAGRELKGRLASMGLVLGVEITVVNNGCPGPFVVSVRDSKMMLGKGMANKIIVK